MVRNRLWVTNAAATLDRFQYGFDRDSNVLTRTNLVNTSFSESYNYDPFNQLTYFQRGSHKQTWTLDLLDNGQQFTDDGNPQTRTNNVQNQITSISGTNAPTYDNNGNTLTFDVQLLYTCDGSKIKV